MAGKDLYIQPIIDNSLSAMTANIASMNTQLSETTRILMNILNNQGLEQHQSAYTGAAFSALTLTGDISASYNYTSNVASSVVSGSTVYFYKTAGPNREVYTTDPNNCNLTETSEISVTIDVVYQNNFTNLTLTKNGIDTTITGVTAGKTVTFTIPEEDRIIYDKVSFTGAVSNVQSTDYTFTYTGGNFAFKEIPHIAFNTNNILTLTTSNANAPGDYSVTRTGYITITDIQGVSTWVSALLKGNLEGVSVALVDNTTHDLIKVLPTSTSDISDVQQLSGLALMVTFAGDGNALKFMSGFSMRYY